MDNARDVDGVVHGVAVDDDRNFDNREYGHLLCGIWFFWRMSPFNERDRERNQYRLALRMNPTKEMVTCFLCLGF